MHTPTAPLPEAMCFRHNSTPWLTIGSEMGAETPYWPVRSRGTGWEFLENVHLPLSKRPGKRLCARKAGTAVS